jgi:hypothetical protein
MRSEEFHAGSRARSNSISPERLTAAERLTEIAHIFALGLTRLRARQSSRLSGHLENSCVDFIANQSGGAVEIKPTENAR